MTSDQVIHVFPATFDRWADMQELFSKTACWCQYWRMSASEYGRRSKNDMDHSIAERRQTLLEQTKGETPPGVLAYLNEKVVGWCGFGPRADMERLVRSRTIPVVDTIPVWSIVCFLVRQGYRRRGVARSLLDGAIACAREYHVPALEAYPVDSGGKRIDTTFAYVGTISMFERAGFRQVLQTSSHSAGLPRWLVRLDLSSQETIYDA